MTERTVDLVPGLIRGHKRDGRCIYDRKAKRELVRRCLQPGVSVAGLVLAHGINANLLHKSPEGHLEIVLAGGTVRICGHVEAQALRIAIDCLAQRT